MRAEAAAAGNQTRTVSDELKAVKQELYGSQRETQVHGRVFVWGGGSGGGGGGVLKWKHNIEDWKG